MQPRILPLSEDAISQIHSSKQITSLPGVVLALVTTSQWALGTAARTAATFDTAESRAAGPLRLLPRDLPQGP